MKAYPVHIFKKIREIEVATTHLVDGLLAGAWASAFKGRGIEFEEVRKYEQGDDIRTIDWNVTARMGEPFVRRFQEERDLTVMLLVDLSGSLKFGRKAENKKSLAAEVSAAIAFSAIKNHDSVGLILFTDHVEHYVPPKKGKRHVLRIIRDILLFEPQGKKTSLESVLKFFGSVMHKRAITFLFSDFYTEEDFERPLQLLSDHDLIFLKVVDPFEKKPLAVPLLRVKDLETDAVDLYDTENENNQTLFQETVKKREERLSQLSRKNGIDLLELSTDGDFVSSMRRFFKLRKKRRR